VGQGRFVSGVEEASLDWPIVPKEMDAGDLMKNSGFIWLN
jgi:hypothetical protein